MARKKKNTDVETPEVAPEITPEQEQTEEQAEAVEKAPVSEQDLHHEVEAIKQKADENWDLYLRERAELENARKRHQRDREEAIRFANDRLLKEMIPVLDNLERAIEHSEQEESNHQGLLEGVNMTINQFRKALEDFGVKPITAVGEAFDPNLHQAMGQVETEEQEPNTNVSEFQKGYLLHERLLRPSLVMVAKAPASESTKANNDDN